MFEIVLILILIYLFLLVSTFFLKLLIFVAIVYFVFTALYTLIFGAPYLPIKREGLKAILELGAFKKGDRVVDLGAGDGRVVAAIADQGVKEVVGYEFSLPTFLIAAFKLRKSFADVVFADFWRKDLSKFNKIVCFLLDSSMRKFEKEVWPKLEKGTVVISNQFPMKSVKHTKKIGRVYRYVKK